LLDRSGRGKKSTKEEKRQTQKGRQIALPPLPDRDEDELTSGWSSR
jgi:hypothetical protein